jgi:AraC family transcriptional activator of pobA
MAGMQPHRIKTISEFHKLKGLPKPHHPLISVINFEDVPRIPTNEGGIVKDFYSIALKRNFYARIKYGQEQYDFDEGTMFFMSPGQVLR